MQHCLNRSPPKPDDLPIVTAILAHVDLLEARWDRVEELCHCVPQTLVHGDFTKSNVRVRSSPSGINLMVFDWGMAGYGFPGIDLAEPSDRGATRDRIETELLAYWNV